MISKHWYGGTLHTMGFPKASNKAVSYFDKKVVYHLESRWRNSHVLVYHGPLQIATLWEWLAIDPFTMA